MPSRIAFTAKRGEGPGVSREECQAGMEACLAKGWLRVIDERVAAGIDALLRSDPARALLPGEAVPETGEVDFTPAGAALYLAVAEDLFGPGWDCDVCVWREVYREEHRYGESEQDILSALGERRDGDEIVSAAVVPIGSWCVWWWERFPRGYRLELEIRSSGPEVR